MPNVKTVTPPDRIIRVAPDGSDSNSGRSWTLPKLTLDAGIDALPAAGGEVRFTGVLAGTVTLDRGNVSIRGTGHSSVLQVTTNAPALSISNADNIDLRDFRIIGTGNPASTLQRGVQAINMGESTISGLRVYDAGYDGILLLSGCTGNTITDCHVYDPGDDGINIGGDDVAATSHNVVHGCHVSGAGAVGYHLSTGSDFTTVTACIATGCTTAGLDTLTGVDRNTIVGNVLSDGITLGSDWNVVLANITTVTDNGANNTVASNVAAA